MMILDAHTHVFSPEMESQRKILCRDDPRFAECYTSPAARMVRVETLLEVMDKADVARAVVMGYAFADAARCAVSNDYIIEAVQRYPGRFIGLGAVQPLAGDKAVYEAERCIGAGLSGLGELTPDGQRFDLTDIGVMVGIAEVLVKFDKPLLVHASEPVGHIYGGKGHTTPEKILKLAENFPRLKIIAAHWGGGLPFYELMPEVRSSLANLYYDTAATSYLYSFDIFRTAIAACGISKILFASDFPVLGPSRLIRRVLDETGLNPEELEAVLGGNAVQLFGQVSNNEAPQPTGLTGADQ